VPVTYGAGCCKVRCINMVLSSNLAGFELFNAPLSNTVRQKILFIMVVF